MPEKLTAADLDAQIAFKAAPITITEEVPQAGGSYIRDPLTGGIARNPDVPQSLHVTEPDTAEQAKE